MSREKTEDEVRDEFLEHIRVMIDYWNNVESQSTKDKLEGLAFSILVAIDGGSSALPSFVLAPLPHEDDKQFNIDGDEDYYPENHNSDVKCDIAGYLHELLFRK